MDLTSYIAIQNQIQAYRNNLHRLEDKVAFHGGYTLAPLEIQNTYDETKETIEKLVKDLHQIEHRMIHEISVIRDAFANKNSTIMELNQEIDRLSKKIEENSHNIQARDREIEELSWRPLNLKALTPQQRKKAYEEVQAFASVVAAYGDELAEDYKSRRIGLNRIVKRIIEEYTDFLMKIRNYY